MHVLAGIALKSLFVAGFALLLLKLLRNRSAAERSWIAHIGLMALVIVAFAPLLLPSWTIETPALLGQNPSIEQVQVNVGKVAAVPSADGAAVLPGSSRVQAAGVNPATAISIVYALPAAILLIITLVALGRLIALRARADVLVDGHWLSALARAQRRMGFKHGTALLTSEELASPISWGLMRPVILLSSRAVEASNEAEAIIAHELAHVARMDWAKLLLARIATALFWFNPLVWLLAREAHQLREETADDAVLGANIPDTDYAQLLVGVARHECPGLLLGAHGVAPSRSSLARRVARVLDGQSVRGPVARGFAAGVFAGAVLVAAPLAALTLAPAGAAAEKAKAASGDPSDPYYSGADSVPTDLPNIIGQGVAASVESAVAAIHSTTGSDAFDLTDPSGARITSSGGTTVMRSADGSRLTVYPPDSRGLRKIVARAADGATAVSYVDKDDVPGLPGDRDRDEDSPLQKAVAMKAVGVTGEYIAAMRAASPTLRDADADEFVGMKAVGVTPDYVRDLASAGFANLDADELSGARAVGVTGAYIRDLRANGIRDTDLDEITGARAVGVDSNYIREMRAAGFGSADLDELTGARAVGVTPDYVRQMRLSGIDGDLDDFTSLRAVTGKGKPPHPPRPPRLTGG